jgi:hypothetical protein
MNQRVAANGSSLLAGEPKEAAPDRIPEGVPGFLPQHMGAPRRVVAHPVVFLGVHRLSFPGMRRL